MARRSEAASDATESTFGSRFRRRRPAVRPGRDCLIRAADPCVLGPVVAPVLDVGHGAAHEVIVRVGERKTQPSSGNGLSRRCDLAEVRHPDCAMLDFMDDARLDEHEPRGPSLSVRGEVERLVDPDSVVLDAQIAITRDDKESSLRAATVALDNLRAALEKVGAVVRTASTQRHPITWSTHRVTTTPEFDDVTKAQTGRITANVGIHITLRDFDLLDELEQITVEVSDLRIGYAHWAVDSDNPAWPEVRAEAIREAFRKGSHYAAALGASLVAVDHIADAGLLGTDEGARLRGTGGFPMTAGGGVPLSTLDPVPQQLVARIEARFGMTPVPLPLDGQ